MQKNIGLIRMLSGKPRKLLSTCLTGLLHIDPSEKKLDIERIFDKKMSSI